MNIKLPIQVMFTKLFPVVNASIYFAGEPSSNRWNEMSIFTYESHRSSCELAQSVIFADHVHLKRRSCEDTLTYVARRLQGVEVGEKGKKEQ